uniref:Ig-like domain-containing protein n=1 Tax=Catagonus wagneri TaxID=51154 RepID=A0A8C3WLZ2_9CETA
MVPLLLLLPLLWGGSLQEGRGYWLQVQESVTVPECLDVNVTCSFSDPWSRWYPAGQLFIYWFREGDDIRSSEPVATNDPRRAVKQETQGRFQLLGDPESNDCSLSIRDARMSDTGVYFFRVERGERSKYKYSYRDKTLKLQVTASLAQDHWYQLELQQNVTVQEGLCVQVPCTFSYPWGSFGTTSVSWFRKGAGRKRDLLVATNKLGQKLHEGSQGRFFLLGDPQANNCSLSIRDVNAGDSGTYFFQMEVDFRKHAYRDKPLSLEVTALSLTPHILVPESLESGRPSNLTCAVPWACEGGTPPIFSWTSAALTSLGPRTALSSVVTLTPRPQDHGASLTCQVMLPASGVTVERTVRLNVTYAPQNVTISVCQGSRTALKIRQNASSLPVLEGQALQLRCVADGNPPVQLSWFRGSPAPKATPISGTATLELPDVGTVAGEVTCRAQNPLGSRNLSLSLSVVCECGDPWGQNTCIRGWGWGGEAPLTRLLPRSRPTAAGSLLLLGGRGSALQLLLPSPARPLPALAAGGGAAGREPQQRLGQGHLQLRRALGQQLPEPQRGAQLRPQSQLRGPERPRGAERHCPAVTRSEVS